MERQELVPKVKLSLLNMHEEPCVGSYKCLNKVLLGGATRFFFTEAVLS